MWILLAVALLASNVDAACGRGCEEWKGNCACDQKPEQLSQKEEVQPSDEKPRRGQQPEWETGEVSVGSPVSRKEEDENWDKQKYEADIQGKKAAGIIK